VVGSDPASDIVAPARPLADLPALFGTLA